MPTEATPTTFSPALAITSEMPVIPRDVVTLVPTAGPFIPPGNNPSPTTTEAPVAVPEDDDISVIDGGLAVGLISALAVGGLAAVVAAVVVQRRRFAKEPAEPEVVSEFSSAVNEV